MAFIDSQPVVETIGENCHMVEFNFTVNNYRDISSLDFIREHRILCERFGTEWTVWILFQKTDSNEPVSCIVSISRTDDEEIKVMVSLSMLLHNVSTLACSDVLDVPATKTAKDWEFQKYIDPLLQSENSAILNDGNLDVKFCLTVFDCHE
ncbi:hypothetical protein AVEN_57058-1 [Araneus ventricosus]|uniref:MATH domain-containing protein n=1 Tax=Araneus ventricosus TaxID=182803 RepID=A0A4Y2XCT7_ARAVE|nr:hypothetical protein AVEN_57058-1 [Araneus ventricosus]